MMQQWWEIKHEWLIEDYKFYLNERAFFFDLLKRNPEGPVGNGFREILKNLELNLKDFRKEYRKIYGRNPSIQPYTASARLYDLSTDPHTTLKKAVCV